MSSEQNHGASPMSLTELAENELERTKDLGGDSCSPEMADKVEYLPCVTSNGDPSVGPGVDSKSEADAGTECEMVEFKVIYNKQTYNVKFPLDDTVNSLKQHIASLTSVPEAMQKIMFKGRMKDELTLRDHKLVTGSKVMVVGSTVDDVKAVNQPAAKAKADGGKVEAVASKEPLCKQKVHKTVLDKYGKPDDVMPGIKNKRDPLPPTPLVGMYNKSGGKVRLTFKLENDQLWIGTKERTEKIALTSIKAVVSEEIEGHEEYHLVGLQLGPTELSRYWIYWVPAQYVDAIKDAVLGNWQYF